MQLLVRAIALVGDSAHIAGPDGQPICKAALKLSAWLVQERDLASVTICRRCLRKHTMQQA